MPDVAVCLRIDADSSVRVEALLKAATQRLASDPALATELPDGTFRIQCALPDGYKPRMNQWATGLTGRIGRDGCLFEISETSPGISGGWMASCIPPPMYRTFLAAWLAHTSVRQLELFA